LAQKVPFENKGAAKLFCSGDASFPIATLHAKHVSTECVSFLESLIVPEPSKRLSAEAALNASWLGKDLTERVSFQKSLVVLEPSKHLLVFTTEITTHSDWPLRRRRP
jgi:hypothetical protein